MARLRVILLAIGCSLSPVWMAIVMLRATQKLENSERFWVIAFVALCTGSLCEFSLYAIAKEGRRFSLAKIMKRTQWYEVVSAISFLLAVALESAHHFTFVIASVVFVASLTTIFTILTYWLFKFAWRVARHEDEQS